MSRRKPNTDLPDELLRQVPEKLRGRLAEIVALTDRFCDEHLDAEDTRWSTRGMLEHKPLVWMEAVNGLPYDIRMAPRHVQEEAVRRGLIPFMSGDEEEAADLRFAAVLQRPEFRYLAE